MEEGITYTNRVTTVIGTVKQNILKSRKNLNKAWRSYNRGKQGNLPEMRKIKCSK